VICDLDFEDEHMERDWVNEWANVGLSSTYKYGEEKIISCVCPLTNLFIENSSNFESEKLFCLMPKKERVVKSAERKVVTIEAITRIVVLVEGHRKGSGESEIALWIKNLKNEFNLKWTKADSLQFLGRNFWGAQCQSDNRFFAFLLFLRGASLNFVLKNKLAAR
jgi:hypothetical protein